MTYSCVFAIRRAHRTIRRTNSLNGWRRAKKPRRARHGLAVRTTGRRAPTKTSQPQPFGTCAPPRSTRTRSRSTESSKSCSDPDGRLREKNSRSVASRQAPAAKNGHFRAFRHERAIRRALAEESELGGIQARDGAFERGGVRRANAPWGMLHAVFVRRIRRAARVAPVVLGDEFLARTGRKWPRRRSGGAGTTTPTSASSISRCRA